MGAAGGTLRTFPPWKVEAPQPTLLLLQLGYPGTLGAPPDPSRFQRDPSHRRGAGMADPGGAGRSRRPGPVLMMPVMERGSVKGILMDLPSLIRIGACKGLLWGPAGDRTLMAEICLLIGTDRAAPASS